MIILYNTKTKSKEKFIPLKNDQVGIYVCGPTVYDFPHLGNALSVVVYDFLYRLLRHEYENVVYVRNITDVDDKINNAAKERGISIGELTSEIIAGFTDDIKALNCLQPTFEPKATTHIKEMIEMIEILIAKKHAYVAENHVFFAVKSYPDYGEISGRILEDLISGSRVEISGIKLSAEDFVLWKPADVDTDPSAIFDSPWGKGRPGWHIECSAMACKYLGSDFDIHGGGIDLLFPHHTNEIAQSCCAYEGSGFANFWVHNGFLTVEGEKMSKSLGNFITLRELLAKNIPGEVIRYVFMASHYRKPSDWNVKEIYDAKNTLDNYYNLIDECRISHEEFCEVDVEFIACLKDDLNTPVAYAYLHELAKISNIEQDPDRKRSAVLRLKSCANLIGFLENTPKSWFQGNISKDERHEIEKQMLARNEAKKNKNFSLADSIRDMLKVRGIFIEDKKDGTTIWKNIGVQE